MNLLSFLKNLLKSKKYLALITGFIILCGTTIAIAANYMSREAKAAPVAEPAEPSAHTKPQPEILEGIWTYRDPAILQKN